MILLSLIKNHELLKIVLAFSSNLRQVQKNEYFSRFQLIEFTFGTSTIN